MVYNFLIYSPDVANFKREISIDASATFEDLKNAICSSVDYDKYQLCSFFLCEDNWERSKEITLEDMDTDPEQDVWLMDECALDDYLDDEDQKLIFVFDYMTDRYLKMKLTKIETGKMLKDPLCTLSLGQAPAQNVDLDDFTSKIDAKASSVAPSIDDIEEEFYGDEEFNEDEFEGQGFSEMPYDD